MILPQRFLGVDFRHRWCHVLSWSVAMKRSKYFSRNSFEKYRSVAFQQAQNHQNRFTGMQKAFIFSAGDILCKNIPKYRGPVEPVY